FLQDNCATRVRDVMVRVFGDTLVLPEKELDLSYRDVLKPYFRPMPWTRFGANLLLGLPADRKLDSWHAMFLPDNIIKVFDSAKLKYNDGQEENLVISTTKIMDNDFEIGKKPWFNPTLVFWSLLIVFIVFSFFELKKKIVYKGVDFVLYFILGIVGILLLLFWFVTDHTPPKWNLNLLWAFPTHIWFAFVYLKNKKLKLIKIYSLIFGLLNIMLVITYPIFPQDYDYALIPFFLLIGGRMLKRYWEIRKKNIWVQQIL
ncbi:MAG: hypothetical protein U9Q83_05740, partial [Bacteroidota bacterium]|nr:hypothetical protein [Bacteroidota bacterium]